ncbi:hypothetical protein Bbelb_243110 [Branchiostoma belcheri]|nr:hypothetical protein Bbelb_243110 [Branchiostoma belcheri]
MPPMGCLALGTALSLSLTHTILLPKDVLQKNIFQLTKTDEAAAFQDEVVSLMCCGPGGFIDGRNGQKNKMYKAHKCTFKVRISTDVKLWYRRLTVEEEHVPTNVDWVPPKSKQLCPAEVKDPMRVQRERFGTTAVKLVQSLVPDVPCSPEVNSRYVSREKQTSQCSMSVPANKAVKHDTKRLQSIAENQLHHALQVLERCQSPKARRKTTRLAMLYKIQHMVCTDGLRGKIHPAPSSERRGHDQQMAQDWGRTRLSFLPRTVKERNSFPQTTVDATNTETFVARASKFC